MPARCATGSKVQASGTFANVPSRAGDGSAECPKRSAQVDLSKSIPRAVMRYPRSSPVGSDIVLHSPALAR